MLGLGSVGSALREWLPRAGTKVQIAWKRSNGRALPPLDVDVVFLAVPDSAVAQVCRLIEVGPRQLVLHLAGALSLDALDAARRKGARVGSLHPLRAFVRGRREGFSGAAAAVAGSDAATLRQISALARRLDMRPIATRGGSRALYHAAAVLAAGSQVALFAEAVRVFRAATGVTEPAARAALLPLTLGALEQLRPLPPARAITGPAARGDRATIRAHRKALPRDLVPLYDALTRVMIELRPTPRAALRGGGTGGRSPLVQRRRRSRRSQKQASSKLLF